MRHWKPEGLDQFVITGHFHQVKIITEKAEIVEMKTNSTETQSHYIKRPNKYIFLVRCSHIQYERAKGNIIWFHKNMPSRCLLS